MKKLIALSVVVLGVAAGSGHATSTSGAHHDAVWKQKHAIMAVFCGWMSGPDVPCQLGRDAQVVASEEGGKFHWYRGDCNNAENGQYLGCFQMGSSERAKYGHGPGFWAQAKAALAYFIDSGRDWSPWSCKPQGYCLT